MQATTDFNFRVNFTANSMAATLAVFTAVPGDRAVVVEARADNRQPLIDQ